MDKTSIYQYIGVPDALAVALVLISLSATLTPWFGGVEFGPLKVPNLNKVLVARLRICAPLLLFLSIVAFLPIFSSSADKPMLSSVEASWLRGSFGETVWNGPSWGTIEFSQSGQIAQFTGATDGLDGEMKIYAAADESKGEHHLFSGSWSDEEGRSGEIKIIVIGETRTVTVRWGPDISFREQWKLQSNHGSIDTVTLSNETLPTSGLSHVVKGLKPDGHCYLSLREDSNSDSQEVTRMIEGTWLHATEQNGKWMRVKTQDGFEGWAHSNWIESANISEFDQCEMLWRTRNSIYNSHGYCFQTGRGKDAFSNDDCIHGLKATELPLSRCERYQVDKLVVMEERLGC